MYSSALEWSVIYHSLTYLAVQLCMMSLGGVIEKPIGEIEWNFVIPVVMVMAVLFALCY